MIKYSKEVNVGDNYIQLQDGDVIRENDEYLSDLNGQWYKSENFVGHRYLAIKFLPHRRLIEIPCY